MRDLKLYFLLFLISSICRSQQESNFSYYMFNHQAINPAYTGSRGITNLTSVIRSQWVGLEGAPETQDNHIWEIHKFKEFRIWS